MASIDDIRRSLSSEKVTVRKKGTVDCEELVFRNKTILASKSAMTMALIRSLMEYEVKELDHNQSKDKVTPNEVPIFVKKMVKYCAVYGQVISHKIVSFLEHMLNVLYEPGLPPTYKQEHRSLLSDLLVPRIIHSVPFDRQDKQSSSVGLNKLFLYLKDIITDAKSISDNTNLKLLRLMCRSLIADSSNDPGTILKFLLQWFNDLLVIASKESNQCLPQLTACLADCCIYFMEIQQSNLCTVLCAQVDLLLQSVIKQLSTHQYRDSQRVSFLKFVKLLFEVSHSFNWKDSSNRLSAGNPLRRHIQTLCNVMCSDESVRAVMSHANTYVTTSGGSSSSSSSSSSLGGAMGAGGSIGFFRAFNQQGRDIFPSILDDSLMQLNFEVMAYAAYHQNAIVAEQRLQQQQKSKGNASRNKAFQPFDDLAFSGIETTDEEVESVSGPKKKQRTAGGGLAGGGSSSGSLSALNSNSSNSNNDNTSSETVPFLEALYLRLGGGLDSSVAATSNSGRGVMAPVFTRTQPVVLTQKRPLSMLTQAAKTGGASGGGEGATVTATSGVMNIRDQNTVNDGLLYLTVAIFRMFPDLHITGAVSEGDSVVNLVAWIKLIVRKLKGCILSAHTLHNQQQCALLLLSLQQLAVVSRHLMTNPKTKSTHSSTVISNEWCIALRILIIGDGSRLCVLRYVEDSATTSNGGAYFCKRHSLMDRVICVVSTVLSLNLLSESAMLHFGQEVLWSPGVVREPCLVDSPAVFALLANVIGGGGGDQTTAGAARISTCGTAGDVPADWCLKYVRRISEALDASENEVVGFSEDTVDPHIQALTQACLDFHKMDTAYGSSNSVSHMESVLHQGLEFVSLWLVELVCPTLQMINGRDCTGSSKVSVAHLHDYNTALSRLIGVLLCQGSGQSTTECDVVPANRGIPDLNNRASLHWLDLIPTTGDSDIIDLAKTPMKVSMSSAAAGFKGDVTQAVALLNHVKNHLLAQRSFTTGLPSAFNGSSRRGGVNGGVTSNAPGASQRDDPYSGKIFTICNTGGVNVDLTESIIAWQVCSVMLLNLYANMAACLLSGCEQTFQENTQSMDIDDDLDSKSQVPLIFESFLTLLYVNLSYMSSKMSVVKPAQLAEFCAELSFVCCRMVDAVKDRSDLVNFNGLKQCIDLLYALLRALQTEACNKDTGTDSSLNNVDFEKSDRSGGGGGGVDFDDDDFDVTPTSRQTQMLRASQAKARAYEDLDDDFIPAGKQLVSGGGTRLVRSNFSLELLRSFVALSQCVVLLTSMTSRPLALVSILDSLPLNTSSAGGGGGRTVTSAVGSDAIKVYTPSEVYLILAEHISLLSSVLDRSDLVAETVRSLIDGCGWHIDWGMLGYCKVLRIIYNTTKTLSFWRQQTTACSGGRDESVMKYFLALVLPNNDPVVEAFVRQIFTARVNQLECLGNCLEHCTTADIGPYKQQITGVFVEAMGDRDVRVRLTAAQKLPLLLPHFKNRDNVYNALVKASNIPVYYNLYIDQHHEEDAEGAAPSISAEEDPLMVVSTAVTLVLLGSSCGPDSALTKRALLDLMLLCCSRRKFFVGRPGQDVSLYRDLLHTLTEYLSSSLGYSDEANALQSVVGGGSRLVLQDNLRWLFHQWLVVINGTELDEDADQKLLTLKDFPYELLLKHSQTQHSSGCTNPKDCLCQYSTFVTSFSDALIPIIASVGNARLRWKLLLQCSEGWYGSALRTTDKDIGLLIKSNICSVKALEFFLMQIGSVAANKATGSAGKALQDFVNRALKIEPKDVLARLSDTVLALFSLLASEKASELEGTASVVSEKAILGILNAICDHVGGEGVSQMLLNDCNLLEILSTLRCRLLETRQVTVFHNVMNILSVVWSNNFQSVDDLSVCFFHGVLSVLKVAIDQFPTLLDRVLSLIQTIVSDMCGSHGDCKEGGPVLLPHLFAELICLLHSVHARVKATSNLATDKFSLQYFSSLGSVEDPSESLKSSAATLAKCIEQLVIFIKVSDNDEMLKFLLPLPLKYLNYWRSSSQSSSYSFGDGSSASYRSKRTLSSVADSFGDNPVCDFVNSQRWATFGGSAPTVMERVSVRMREFVRLAKCLAQGEVFRPSMMWLQLVILQHELLQYDPLEQEVQPPAWWWGDEYCSLTSCFVSSLLSFGSIYCSSDSNNNKAAEDALVEVAQSVLGHIGPPDVFTLKHGADFTQLDPPTVDIRTIQLSVLHKVYSLLWGSCEECEEATKCLRSLTERQYLSIIQSEMVKKNADGTVSSNLSRPVTEILSSFSVLNDSPSNVTIKTGDSAATNRDRSSESFATDVWTCEGKSYPEWISRLVHHLIDCNYTEAASTMADGDTVPGFLLACKNVVKVRHDIAEALLPILVFNLLTLPGVNQSLLAEAMTKYVLSEDQCIPLRVTQQGCAVLTFILRQNVKQFIGTSVSGGSAVAAVDTLVETEQTAKGATIKRPRNDQSKAALIVNSSVPGEYTAPYSIQLDIDYTVAARAAARCHAVCSALLFAEMGEERSRHITAAVSAATAGSATEIVRSNSLVRANSGVHINSRLNQVLMPIYQGIHDPDSLYGIDMSSSLSLQAKMYEHRGCWLEALGIYESILQSAPDGDDSNISPVIEEARCGIANALSGLGAEATLRICSTSGNSNNNSSGMSASELQKWTIQGSDSEVGVVSLGHSVLAGLKDLSRNRAHLAQHRLNVCSHLLFNDIILKTSEESAHSVVSELSLAQQLIEINEVCCVVQSQEEAVSRVDLMNVDELLSRWDKRQSGVTPVVNLHTSSSGGGSGRSSSSRSFQSLRFALFSHLLQCDLINPVQAIEGLKSALAIHPALRTLNNSKEREVAAAAHAVGPLMYKYWNSIQHHIEQRNDGSTSSSSSSNRSAELIVIYAEWQLQESKLLWRKGMKEVAVSNVNQTIRDLRQFVEKQSGSNSNNTRGTGGKSENRAKNILSEAMRLGGEWIGTKRAATGTDILTDYLNPAAAFAVSVTEQIKTFETLGAFNARLFQNVSAKVNSVEWQQGARVLADRVVEYEQCKALQVSERAKKPSAAAAAAADATAVPIDLKALDRHTHILKKEIDMDTKERAAVEASVGTYLAAALTDYAKVLQLSPEEDLDTVVRVINLWLGSAHSAQVNELIGDLIVDRVPSYKFVPLTYQILSRLGKSGDGSAPVAGTVNASKSSKSAPTASSSGFQEVLSNLVFRLCSDHPHHTLPQLFALTHENELEGYDGAAQFKSNISHGRCEAASDIVNRLIKREEEANAKFRQDKLVVAMKNMLLAYIDLAKTSTVAFQKTNRIKDIKYSNAQPRGKCFHECFCVDSEGRPSDKRPVSVITLNLKLNPLKDYSNIVRTTGFLSTFSITENGISRPKIITCLGSDGRQYKQLVKGGDDMRQDAVMEQVFDMVNYMLSKDTEARKRSLLIRTYKIIPTTPQTGVLQWVENTAAFGALINDKREGTHDRYYRKDWTHAACREYLKDAVDLNDKLTKYKLITENFHPSFRYFFLEKYTEPTVWMAARLAYSRSVAVASMVGYILGIGDRHSQNILMDTRTGEVVHIDFGIVFEQGKGLGAPETVPFRLTRDVVDGMGITGVEGTFRKSCEEVLRVLRDNALQIMTILEVVIHDPLYKWSLSPLQARMKQNAASEFQSRLSKVSKVNNNDSNVSATSATGASVAAPAAAGAGGLAMNPPKNTNTFGKDAAERTLQRIKNKLQGCEDPTGESLSIEGLVDLLITEARDAKNLCRLFVGWAPWL